MAVSLRTDGLEVHRAHLVRVNNYIILGERSSGTNLCEYFAENAFGLKPSPVQRWKHGFPSDFVIPRNCVVFISFRELMPWVKSMYVKPWHCHGSMVESGFSHFIRAEWNSVLDMPRAFGYRKKINQDLPLLAERHPLTGLPFENLIALRNSKNTAFLGMRNRGCNYVILRHETLRDSPQETLTAISEKLQIKAPATTELPSQNLVKKRERLIAKRKAEVQTISDEDRSFIFGAIDHQVEAELGYTYQV